MSSVETTIVEIENGFTKLLEAVYNLRKQKAVSENDAVSFFGVVVDFQRKLEYYKESTSIFSGRPYFKRTLEQFQTIIDDFSTEEKRAESKSYYRLDNFQSFLYGNYCDYMEGIVYEAKEMLERARVDCQTAVSRSLSFINSRLREEVRTSLIELYGDLRLLASLTIFPIEEKLKIKEQLLERGFNQVADFLEIADQNYSLTPPHLKDTLSNCRNALESTITIFLTHVGLKPAQKFSIDMATLQNKGFLDRETKDVVLSIWSYLSMKGSHSYSQVDKKSISDVDFGLEQTYRAIAQLMTKYQSFKNLSEKI